MGYLGSSEAILKQQYQLGDRFPFYFALLALGVGTASLLNARLVQRFGMYKICLYAILGTTVLAVIYLVAWVGRYAGQPPLTSLMLYLFLSFLHIGLLFGNLNALAMEPIGHMAGLGASLIGAISTLISVGIGTIIGQAYNGTVLPVVLGFALIGFSVSLLLLLTPPPQHKA
jgi:DHA1 family bicyclomycin/chloramphenicol resistance-like MFS transporter